MDLDPPNPTTGHVTIEVEQDLTVIAAAAADYRGREGAFLGTNSRASVKTLSLSATIEVQFCEQ